MECIQGDLLKSETINKALVWEIGSLLARIHLECAEGYGDLTDPSQLNSDSRIPFTMKFEEGLEECKDHLSESLLKTCRHHFDKDIDLFQWLAVVIWSTLGPRQWLAIGPKMEGQMNRFLAYL